MYLNAVQKERVQENSSLLINAVHTTSSHNIWLAALRREVFSKIAPFLEEVSLVAGEYVYRADDLIDYIYFPETAVASEFQILKDGRAVGVSLHGNESILGLSSVFDAHPADNWTQILLSGNACRIKTSIFKTKILQHPSVQQLMFKYVNNYTKRLTQRVVCNSYHSLEERFCAFLLALRDFRESGGFSITQEQIAYFLGTHRPSVTQIAQTLRAKKIINYARRNLTIIDRAKLKNSACECYNGI